MKSLLPKAGTFRVLPVLVNFFTKISNRKFFGVILLTLLSLQTYGQDQNWTLLKEVQGVEVYINVSSCSDLSDASVSLEPSDKIKLKFVNQTGSSKELEFFKVIKTSGNSELVSMTISEGTTEVTECDLLPFVQLTQTDGDGFPVSMLEYFENFSISIK